ncbi:MAG TPA: HD domain-containing phosphohydrolase [Planctomycetota bacterium]|jgi:HD-GYP domain-containing protein (c-di-GMP phosphodiesterase class II)
MSVPAVLKNTQTRIFSPVQGTRLSVLPTSASLCERVEALEEEAGQLALLLEMSQALSAEKELVAAIARIVDYATRIMRCERSSILLLDKPKNELYALVAQGLDVKELRFSAAAGIAGYVVTHGVGLNVPDAHTDARFNAAIDKATGYHTVSILCLPLQDRRGRVLGAIQCLNKKGSNGAPAVFKNKDEVVLSAVAAQAAVYIDNALLRGQMDVIFESFVESTSRAIDERDPCTSGHSQRVMLYALNLARAVHDSRIPRLTQVTYTRERLRQLRYAALLHDVGKIGVREHILCKAARLAPANLETVRQRLIALREKSRADSLAALVRHAVSLPEGRMQADSLHHDAEHAQSCGALDSAWQLIQGINSALYLPDADFAALEELRQKGWLTADEFTHLSVRRGNLTDAEWVDMRSHVEKSYRILRRIPWPDELRDVPEIAFSHHEKCDGSGYPRKLKQEQIHLDAQILCVADIYDALTASDRPYKKAISHEKSRQILFDEEAARGRILPDLVELFFDAECFRVPHSSAEIATASASSPTRPAILSAGAVRDSVLLAADGCAMARYRS